MITQEEKIAVHKRLLPNWLYYQVKDDVIDYAYKKMTDDFESIKDYETLIKQMIRASETIFFKQISQLDRKEFIQAINDQYNNYNLRTDEMTEWLTSTYNLVKNGLPSLKLSIDLKSEFLEWHNSKLSITSEKTVVQDDLDTWKSEYELRQFIDTATRWTIESVYQHKIDLNNYYSIFDYEVKNSRQNFELFCLQLKKRLTQNTNLNVIEIDLKDRFLPMLNRYIEWYNVNKKETEKFNPYNPYEMMFSIIESTKKEILKYFKDSSQVENENPFPLVFISVEIYNCFLEYKKHIIDFYTDYSYLKKRLEKLKLIHYHTDNDFMKFLLNDLKFINHKEFENYSIKYESKLKSLRKSHSEQRENNFNNVFESLLK